MGLLSVQDLTSFHPAPPEGLGQYGWGSQYRRLPTKPRFGKDPTGTRRAAWLQAVRSEQARRHQMALEGKFGRRQRIAAQRREAYKLYRQRKAERAIQEKAARAKRRAESPIWQRIEARKKKQREKAQERAEERAERRRARPKAPKPGSKEYWRQRYKEEAAKSKATPRKAPYVRPQPRKPSAYMHPASEPQAGALRRYLSQFQPGRRTPAPTPRTYFTMGLAGLG